MASVLYSPLNEQQIMMLRLLKKPLPEEDFQKMRRLAVQLLGDQLDELMEDWEEKNNITEDHYRKLSNDHFRARQNDAITLAREINDSIKAGGKPTIEEIVEENRAVRHS